MPPSNRQKSRAIAADAAKITVNKGDNPLSKECHYCGKMCKSVPSRIKHVERCVQRRKFCKYCGQIVFNLATLELHEANCDGVSLSETRTSKTGPFSHFYYRVDQKEGEEAVVVTTPELTEQPEKPSQDEIVLAKADSLILKKTMSTNQLYICGLCEESFPTKDECRQHTKDTHQAQLAAIDTPTSTSPDKEKATKRKPTDSPPSAPPKRGRGLLNPSLKPFSDEEILAKLLERKATFVCKCGVIFKDQTLFCLHKGTHSSKNPYECSFCGHVAPNWYDFTSHFYFHSKPSTGKDAPAQ